MPGTAQLRSLLHPPSSYPYFVQCVSHCFSSKLSSVVCCCIGFICMIFISFLSWRAFSADTTPSRAHETKLSRKMLRCTEGAISQERGGSWMIWIAEHRSLEIKERHHKNATPWPPCFWMLWWFTKVFGPWSLVNFWNLLSCQFEVCLVWAPASSLRNVHFELSKQSWQRRCTNAPKEGPHVRKYA